MVRFAGQLLVLLLAGPVLAGCIGDDATPGDASPFEAEQAKATVTTGSVTGQILTVDLEILPGLQVGLLNRTGALVLTKTDTKGNYTFNGIPAGPYRVQVSDPCCRVATEQVIIEAGQVSLVNLQVERLTEADLETPIVEEGEWDGFLSCAVSVFSLSVSPCSFTDSNHESSTVFNITKGIWELHFAAVWPSASQGVSDELRVELRNRNCGGCSYDYATIIGPSPVSARISDDDVSRSSARFQLIEDKMDMQFLIGAGSNNLVYQQPIRIVWYEFYYQAAPAGFDPVPED